MEILTSTQHPHVYIFDSKYKLLSDKVDEGSIITAPVMDDIHKMHAYRDTIRDKEERQVVDYAAILYPGTSKSYSLGVEAVHAHSEEDLVRALVRDFF